ncbi:MAG: ABC transporter substrate-binding protein [Bacteroidales bacterium]|nr:ABC transporter substrate-binding protein [Bacteroidales bacterium]
MLILFSSCGRDNSSDENLKIFKYNEAAGILTLDPIYAKDLPHIWACNQIYNSLVALDDEMNVVPAVAKSWNISDDGMTYTFILRDDVYFHEDECFGKTTDNGQQTTDIGYAESETIEDKRSHFDKLSDCADEVSATQPLSNSATRRVTAHDFVYSFNRVLDRKLNSSGSWIFSNVNAFEAINDTILKIELSQPFPAFLGILSMTYASVVPKEAVDFYGTEFGRHPVGTGPFKYQYWKEGVKLVFRKNPIYFETVEIVNSDIPNDSTTQQLINSSTQQLPYLDAVSISFIIDKQVAFMEFVKGKFDFMSGIDSRYKDELLTRDGQLREEYKDKINFIRQPYLNTEYLAFFLDENDTLGKERSLALRQAVSYSIDREKMLRYLRNGMGTPGNYGIIPVGLPGNSETENLRNLESENLRNSETQQLSNSTSIGYPYNPKKAEQLLKDNNLLGHELKLYTTQEYIDIAKFVQSALTEVGLNCKVEEMMPAALREKRANGNLPFFRSSWVADYPDAENYLSLFTTGNFTPQGPNYTHYSNARFDALYQKSLTCNDIQERAKIYHEMDSIMMSEAPVVILFYDEVMRFVNKRVEGLGSNPTNLLNLKEVKIN